MGSALFEIDAIKDLPLWGQVYIASRMIRRALYVLPASAPETLRKTYEAGCDAIDRCAEAGEWLKSEKPAIKRAGDCKPIRATSQIASAFHYVADATHAAHDSLDFSAAETSSVRSSYTAIGLAACSPGLNALQATIFAASDLDQLRFACKEGNVGRYDGLGSHVIGRMAPIHPPREKGAGSREL